MVDDHRIVREGLKQILADTSDIVVTGEARDDQTALSKIRKNDYDVVAVLVLSMYSEEEYATRFLRMGASGYLTRFC
jgi:DNA-binding NarL/FixJ family response regulator